MSLVDDVKAGRRGRLRTRGGYVLREYVDKGDHYVVTDWSRRCIVPGGGPALPETIVRKRGARE